MSQPDGDVENADNNRATLDRGRLEKSTRMCISLLFGALSQSQRIFSIASENSSSVTVKTSIPREQKNFCFHEMRVVAAMESQSSEYDPH